MKKLVCVFAVFAVLLSMAFAQEVEVFPQLGHSRDINSVAFSPDGKYVVSGSNDNMIKLWDVSSGREIRNLSGHVNNVNSVAINHDGTRIISGSHDYSIRLWDVASGREIQIFMDVNAVSSVVFSPDGKYIVSGTAAWFDPMNPQTRMEDNAIVVWDTDLYRVEKDITGLNAISSLAFSPDGKQFASSSYDGKITLWDVETWNEINSFVVVEIQNENRQVSRSACISSIEFSPDGKYLVSGSTDRNANVKLWDIASGNEIWSSNHMQYITSVAFSPDGKTIASASWDNIIILWDAATGNEIWTHKFSENNTRTLGARSLTFSPDGNTIASGLGNQVILLDITTGQEKPFFSYIPERISSVSFIPDSKQIISTSNNELIQLWDTEKVNIIWTSNFAENSRRRFNSIELSPDGKTFITGSDARMGNASIQLWDVSTGKEIRTLVDHSNSIRTAIFSPDGKFVIFGTWNFGDYYTLKLFDISTSHEIWNITGSRIGVGIRSAVFSPDGKTIALIFINNNSIMFRDTATGNEILTISGDSSTPFSIAYSPDGQTIASGSGNTNEENSIIKLWGTETGREIQLFNGHVFWVRSLAFSPDGKKIVSSGSLDQRIKIWDIETGIQISEFVHFNTVNSVSFSPCGTRILSASDDGTIRLWDIATGKEIASFISFTDGEWIVITPDGFYNSSPKGDQHLNVRIGNEVYGMDQFADTFYQPEVVKARLQGLPDPSIVRQRGSIQTASIPPAIRVNASEVDAVTRQVTLSVSATDWIRQINNIEIIVNGRRIGGEELLNVTTTNLTTARAQ
ncbi:MAG: WD40 repeat domain-containing protein, partial [Treponema sp.]|nr:WD40 repeat domain-containing protein [Treponema sp.]